MTTIMFTLEIEPQSVQKDRRLVVIGRKPRFFDGPKKIKYKRDIGILTARHRPPSPFVGPVAMEVTFCLSRPKSMHRKADPDGLIESHKRPDLDNLVKSFVDGFAPGFWSDDAQITQLNAAKFYTGKGCVPFIQVQLKGTT
jgi:Holliday junction resolvase RusA-like endonuclease